MTWSQIRPKFYGKMNSQNKKQPERKKIIMAIYRCEACGWEYNEELGAPDLGIAPGTKFEDLPEDFECPLCGVGKDSFSEA